MDLSIIVGEGTLMHHRDTIGWLMQDVGLEIPCLKGTLVGTR